MINLDILKQKAIDTAETIAEKSVEIYKAAEDKTKQVANQAKLAAELTGYNCDLKKLYTELGTAYYNMHKDDPEDSFAQLFTEISFVLEQIEIKQREYNSCSSSAGESCSGSGTTVDADYTHIKGDTMDAENCTPEEENAPDGNDGAGTNE